MPPSDFAIPKRTLDSERFRLVREIFLDAQRFRGAARQSFLAQRCGGDVSLRNQVAELLKHDESGRSVLDKPIIKTQEHPTPKPMSMLPREPVGRFKLFQVLGEGASGITSLAQNPDAKTRRATVKVLHAPLALSEAEAGEVVSRIEVDHRALGALRQHPSPRLLEAGQLSTGSFFVATDFIPGEPILRYCDRVRAGIRARLLLFLDACEAMQAAHQCGVFHAGLTPGNALARMAGDVPTISLLDFGIARALHDLLGRRRAWLDVRLSRGAVEYLAPEQAGEQPALAEPAADIYALGALLYELLTGVAPFDRAALKRAGMGDFPRILAEQAVLDPADRIAELGDRAIDIADRRATSARELATDLRKELGSIPIRALSKSPSNRYPTAAALADDVRTYLDGKPITGATGLGLRVRRFVDRFRGSH